MITLQALTPPPLLKKTSYPKILIISSSVEHKRYSEEKKKSQCFGVNVFWTPTFFKILCSSQSNQSYVQLFLIQ